MQIHKTHVIIKENKDVDRQPLEPFIVYECKTPGSNLAQPGKTIYFREFISGFGNKALMIISEEDFNKMEVKTEEILKLLYGDTEQQ